uniref:HAMP domain-containing protein n=1 Tax=OCS116 cluster bacterium TaxID=2030921 RepID=A0A2A4YWI1_9PROT
MSILLWNPFSISYLVELILVTMVAGYFLNQVWVGVFSGKSNYTSTALCVTFTALTGYILLQFAKVTLHPDYSAYVLAWVSPMGIIALCGFNYFAYHFQEKLKISRLERYLIRLFYLSMIIVEIYVAVERHLILVQGFLEYRHSWMDLLYIVGFTWVIITFFRQMWHAIADEQKINWLQSTTQTMMALLLFWTPLSRMAGTARVFLFFSLLPLLLVFVLYLRGLGVISPIVGEFMSSVMFIFLIFGFAIIFLNIAPEHSSFRIKLVGITLTTILAIMSGVAWLIGPIYAEPYKYNNPITIHSAIRFEPNANGGYTAMPHEYSFDNILGERGEPYENLVELPFDFPYFGGRYSRVYMRHLGMIGFEFQPLFQHVLHRFGPQPAIFPLGAEIDTLEERVIDGIGFNQNRGLFIKKQNDRVVLTWNEMIGTIWPHDEYTFQATLYATGAIEFIYKKLPETVEPDVFLNHVSPLMVGITPGTQNGGVQRSKFTDIVSIVGQENMGLMEDYKLDFLVYLDRIFAPIAYFILLASLFILVIFPIFFRISLDRPLVKLLGGVQQFRDGKLSTKVPVIYRDEIGFLTQSFNQMAQAQHELVNTLEEKVELRTAEATELATKNVRLEERNHLSRELHDTVNQTLFSATLIADTLPELWQKDPERANRTLNEMTQLNRQALSEMRLLLFELRPTEFSEKSFGVFLNNIAKNFERLNQMMVKVQIGNDVILPENVQITFYRIAQECLNNINKHAKTTDVQITFDGLANQAMIKISDTGRGFDIENVPPSHMGLKIMKERIELIGGSFEIESSPSKGTTITAIWYANDKN